MKKTKLLFPFIFVFLSGCAGMQPATEEEMIVERVVQAPGHGKDEIFEYTKMWIAQNFRSAKAVLEYENKDAGRIIGNGSMRYPCEGISCIGKGDWTLKFTMNVDIKDERFKISFTNLGVSWPYAPQRAAYDGPLTTSGSIKESKPVLLAYGDEILAYMNKTETRDSDW